MRTDRYLTLLRADGELLAGAATRDLDAAVPPCPGWLVRDVVTHTAEVYEHKLACIRLRAAPQPWPPAHWPGAADPIGWFTDAHRRMLDVLNSTDPATPAYTWWPADQTVGFWVRRMAQETAMHRVDAQSAFDSVTPVDADLAADGVDEVLNVMLAGDWSEAPIEVAGSGQRVEVSTAGQSWLVTLQAEAVTVGRTDGTVADATVSGPPSELLLWMWGRAPDTVVDVAGDRTASGLLRERLALATG
ncbi:MAG: maleylpyruvate isomerase family mycothiol-dependent enzyme [Actinomycetota bacterium]|nr:maleylpyruvate isomerase family mycothiol-dependent enzyme [Actinomycetota bacterium]